MTTTRTIAPAATATCQFAWGCESGLTAIHRVGEVDLCAYHSPYDADPEAAARYLADLDARNESREMIEITDEAPAEVPTPSIYADWFQALVDRNEVCTNWTRFEREAYQGHIAYSISMTDGHYAPEPFDSWVIDFRKAPIAELYYGNDARRGLAPQANSYASIIARITFLEPTPAYDTLAPKPKNRAKGRESKGNAATRRRANYKR